MNTSLFVLLYKEKERAYVYQYTSFLLLVIDNDNNDTCKTPLQGIKMEMNSSKIS